MAESSQPSDAADPGAPRRKNAIDPDLVKLGRPAPRIGVITAVGVVTLCGVFAYRLNGDRGFAGDETPQKTTVADITAGKVDADHYVEVEAVPVMAHAIRTGRNKNSVGLRVVPARGSSDKLWLVVNGDGWADPDVGTYEGRLEKLSDLPFHGAVTAYANANPRAMFADPGAVRAAFAAGSVATITGDTMKVSDGDKVAIDTVDPSAALVVAVFNERFPDAAAWTTALAAAGIPAGTPVAAPPGVDGTQQLRVEVRTPNAVADITKKLETATLWAARVEPITRHHQTTWGALKASGPAGFTVAPNVTVPDAEIDLVGLYVAKGIPSDAYALITGDRPQQYWYVLPLTVGLGVIGLFFAWVLVRVVKRDLLEPRVEDA